MLTSTKEYIKTMTLRVWHKKQIYKGRNLYMIINKLSSQGTVYKDHHRAGAERVCTATDS